MQPTSQSISSEFLSEKNRVGTFFFTSITDEGKKQEDEAAPAEEPAAEETSGSAGE